MLDFGISAPKSAGEENLSSLFMSEVKSDIAFRVQDQLVPAHKQMLMQKSKYFAKVLNSGMAESTQAVIDIPDCEYGIFKGKERFYSLPFKHSHRIFTISVSRCSKYE